MSDNCFWHGDEPVPANAFRVCFECGHAWPTLEDFVADVHRTVVLKAENNPEQLPFCPLCAHDF